MMRAVTMTADLENLTDSKSVGKVNIGHGVAALFNRRFPYLGFLSLNH